MPNPLLGSKDTTIKDSRGVRSDTNKQENVYLILLAAPGSQVTIKKCHEFLEGLLSKGLSFIKKMNFSKNLE